MLRKSLNLTSLHQFDSLHRIKTTPQVSNSKLGTNSVLIVTHLLFQFYMNILCLLLIFYQQNKQELFQYSEVKYLESKLSSTPVTTPGVVLDCVICSETDPLGKWTVLLHRLGELDLGAECLLGWLLIFRIIVSHR